VFSYKKVTDLVNKHNITFYKLSKETGVSSTVYSEWKSGKSCPKADKIEKIAKYFDVTIEYFLKE